MARLDLGTPEPSLLPLQRMDADQPMSFVGADGVGVGVVGFVNGQSVCQGDDDTDNDVHERTPIAHRACETCCVYESSADNTPTAPTNTSINTAQEDTLNNQLGTETDKSLGIDHDSYIPIGVLRKRNTTSDATTEDAEVFPVSAIANLEKHNWIRTSAFTYDSRPEWSYVRVYVLPDDTGRKIVPRSSAVLRRALKTVMGEVDQSFEAWNGRYTDTVANEAHTATSGSAEDESLWYIFNTLRNPEPCLETMRDPYARQSMDELLSVYHGADEVASNTGRGFSGALSLKSAMYPYQRRSAAVMVQREAQPAQMLDPRLQEWKSPLGQVYYYDKEEGSIVREKRMYSEACGGILAETMGCGKTLICLAVILATQGHFPRIPLQYQETGNIVREKTGSLVEMAAATAGRHSLPWGKYFESLKTDGFYYAGCVRACEAHRGNYTIPPPPTRYTGRNGVAFPRPPAQHLRLCSGTLVVVPPNLVDHWESEISKHTEGLKVLIFRNSTDETPPADELLQYDIVLFSRIRLEKEAGELVANRRVSTRPDDSPLTKLHWLRIIVDEGHNVAGQGQRTNMLHLLDQLRVERRWIVSGTPSSGLYGVEVSLASRETFSSDTDMSNATNTVLRGRKKTGSAVDNELKDLDKLRHIVTDFLDLKPWSNSRAEDPANWTKYIKPVGGDGKRRKAPSLRATLQSLVVRHRMDTIHSEIPLPPLSNKVVHLEPTFFDKLNLNLFIFILAVNAITSERTDQDYMFHPRNRKHLSQTISNLRQAGFWWAGFDQTDISSTQEIAIKYIEKNRHRMSEEDISMLTKGIEIAEKAISNRSWNAFRELHELGVFVQDFPPHACSLWTLDPFMADRPRLLLGISQARQAQRFVTSRLNTHDPAEGLAGAGIKARRELAERETDVGVTGIKMSTTSSPGASPKSTPDKTASPKRSKSFSKGLFKTLPAKSPLARSKIVGTASAKLTYLLDRVLDLHQIEKILIFYDNNNTAFWIAEGLEMIGVDFRIYANTLKPTLRTVYLSLFRENDQVRVLLMDLRQASHGLHIANASRVFIVNPIWQPNVESQAIKRAHRIGQTRPVYVETLVLRNTFEDRMLKRRKEMSDSEIQHAEKDLLDDSTMSTIIQNERLHSMKNNYHSSELRNQPCFFDRHRLAIPDYFEEGQSASARWGAAGGAGLNGRSPCTPQASPSKKPPRKRKISVSLRFGDTPTATPATTTTTSADGTTRQEGQEEGQEEPDLITPKRRKTSSAQHVNEYVNENGIVMTPSRTPPPRRHRQTLSPPPDPYPQHQQPPSFLPTIDAFPPPAFLPPDDDVQMDGMGILGSENRSKKKKTVFWEDAT